MGAALISYSLSTSASEEEKVERLIKILYLQSEKALQCRKKDGGVDGKLIKVSKKFFSSDFMTHYRPVCLSEVDFVISFDIRTADNGIYLYKDSKATFSNLRIGTPIIKGAAAAVVATYDLDEFSFKDWGNFTKFTLVKQGGDWKIDDIELGGQEGERESITSLRSIKSLKKYIDENVEASHQRKFK
jgi:hypothetical protein